jgi:hypothetical protein
MIKLRGPKYMSELVSYKCPFTDKTIMLHPQKWAAYLQKQANGYSLPELMLVYQEQTDPFVKFILQSVIIQHHNSVIQ